VQTQPLIEQGSTHSPRQPRAAVRAGQPKGTPIDSAILLGLFSALGFGTAFVLTQFGLRWMPPWLGAAFSIPTSTLLFWCLAPFSVDTSAADVKALALFAAVGLLFPATVTLLNFESNRLMGPNIAGAVSGVAPVFAVLLALIMLGERVREAQFLALAAIVGGIALMYGGERRAFPSWSLWMLALPLGAAAIRGIVQPAVKLGLERWPDPMAAALASYTVSSAVLIAAAIRKRGAALPFRVEGALWFAAVGIANGAAVLLLYSALRRGPVAVVSPLVATYPLVTLVLSHAFLTQERVGLSLAAGVAVTVAGIILMLLA
jgi:drug/metabolite transporter (DMT)-like permease